MGLMFTRLFSLLFGNIEARILVHGLDNAGKTTILYRLQMGEVVSTNPIWFYFFIPTFLLALCGDLCTPSVQILVCDFGINSSINVKALLIFDCFHDCVWIKNMLPLFGQ
uniref:Uncharacterized protein n=1 Tax=Lactuca sativa TaxID=4236 RepID=A0A9R1XKJ6_LACSA|nr:hypothetical protein LSAT_V11C400158830 [Lactuca sativa]